MQSAQSIADLIPCPNIESAQEVASAIEANLGRGILWILDGWDELPSHLQEKSLLRDIITPSLHSPITQSSVIITSRPISSVTWSLPELRCWVSLGRSRGSTSLSV